jgi:hypothetical protein
MNFPCVVLRVVFFASVFATSMVLQSAALPHATKNTEYGNYFVGALSCLIAGAICLRLIRGGLLTSPSVGLLDLFKAFAKSLAWSYIKLAVVVGLIFLVTLIVSGIAFKDASALSMLFALWLPLWVAPAMASLATGRKLAAGAQNGA